MLIATKTAVHKLPSDASLSELHIIKKNIEFRRVAEGINLDIIALGNGDLVIFDRDEQRTLSTGVEDRVFSYVITYIKILYVITYIIYGQGKFSRQVFREIQRGGKRQSNLVDII